MAPLTDDSIKITRMGQGCWTGRSSKGKGHCPGRLVSTVAWQRRQQQREKEKFIRFWSTNVRNLEIENPLDPEVTFELLNHHAFEPWGRLVIPKSENLRWRYALWKAHIHSRHILRGPRQALNDHQKQPITPNIIVGTNKIMSQLMTTLGCRLFDTWLVLDSLD